MQAEIVETVVGERRAAIRRHHTATHVLHWALREALGDHVKQQGSWVGPDRLRFDFSHFQALTPEEVRAVEDLANREILTNAPCRHYETTKEAALAAGAIAFFGDKYGDTVRVLEAGPRSVELCGGTHVTALGDIGPIKVVSESSIGSNIRRIEAVAGPGPVDLLREAEATLTAAAGELADAAVVGIVVARVETEARDEVRDLAVSLRDKPGVRAVVLMSSPGGKGVAVAAAVAPGSGLDAGELIAEAVKMVGGGGGKGAEVATAGGRDPAAIDAALDHVRASLGLAAPAS